MKGFILMTIFMAAILANNGVANSKKLVVTYLGTDFILPGGCPVLKTGGLSEQQRRERAFNECMKTKSLKQGCFTDKLPDKSFLTIPVLANFCSKHCVADNSLQGIHVCPYEGRIHTKIDPELARRIAE